MKTLFDAADREALVARINALDPAAARQWGKMDPAQMLCHLGRALETATGDRPMKQKFISKNGPTDPTFVVADERDFAAEKARLLSLIDRFAQRDRAEVGKETHAFFG